MRFSSLWLIEVCSLRRDDHAVRCLVSLLLCNFLGLSREDSNGWENNFLATAVGDWRNVHCDDPRLTDSLDPAKERWKAARAPVLEVSKQQSINSGFLALVGGFIDADAKMKAFAETFTSVPPKDLSDKVFKWILDSVSFAVGIGSAFAWNVWIKKAAVFTDDDYRSAWKDVFNAAVAYSIIFSKDGAVPAKTAADLVPILAQAANGVFQALASNHQAAWQEIQQVVSQMYYGRMIPLAWALSQEKQRPFVLRVDREQYRCGYEVNDDVYTKGFNLGHYMSRETAKKTQWCDKDGNAWFLLNAKYPSDCRKHPMRFGCSEPKYYKFTPLAGGDTETLDGKNWGGIRIQDIIRSSYGAFLANDRKNGYSFSLDTSVVLTGDGQAVEARPFPLFDGITTPVNPPENELGYTHGWCGLHITQWSMGTESHGSNPFGDKWQLAVAIKDSTGKIIDQATKQPVDSSFIIKSKLPHELAVSIGSDNLKATQRLCFWYSDQYWCTEGAKSTNDKCKLGKFEGGKREIDCGFACPHPRQGAASTPQVDATKKAPIAFMGSGDEDPEIIGTTKDYNPGWCGVHIRQYQKNEKDNAQNPSTDYALEVTVYDAKQKMIDYLDKTYTSKDMHLHAQGPLPYKLVLWTGAVDDDPVHMAYGKQEWDSKNKVTYHCKQGKYDGGMRDIDCGFTC
ncbi:hypothetical protein CIHG_04844 [Coccidioides immitis H538.4]|uniref:Uncharacterized protein n=1 Tax=Coccidioides immitis H538.4 TaxID=396776 RepID=A0A0J8RP81_COCIT|nr:hypothetical protein CIHG_04844 [Coccidioides immitis H538.4]